MIVDTVASPDAGREPAIERSVKTLLELLMADHPSPCARSSSTRATASWRRWPVGSTSPAAVPGPAG